MENVGRRERRRLQDMGRKSDLWFPVASQYLFLEKRLAFFKTKARVREQPS
jgi:hypothetical protein